MANFKFSMMMMKRTMKDNIFFVLTMVIAITISFIFINIMQNPYIKDSTMVTSGAAISDIYIPFATVICLCVILFCCCMVFFANNFFMSKKMKDVAILQLSGRSSLDCMKYILYQIIAQIFIASLVSFALGYLICPQINKLFYERLNIHQSINLIPVSVLGLSIITVLITLVMLTIFGYGFMYRNDIQTLLNDNSKMEVTDPGNLKARYLVYIALYILGIAMMFMQPHEDTSYLVPAIVGVVGARGIVKKCLAVVTAKIKDKYLLTKRYALIYVSNLTYTANRSSTIFCVLFVIITFMNSIFAIARNQPREFISSVMAYIVIIVLLVISIVYKVTLEAKAKKTLYNNLWKLGYTKKELTKIVRRELLFFYLLLLLVPLIYEIIILTRFVYFNDLTLEFAVIIVLTYVFPVVLSGIVGSIVINNEIVKPIKEVI